MLYTNVAVISSVERFSTAFQTLQLGAPKYTHTNTFFFYKLSLMGLCVGYSLTEHGVCLSSLHFLLHPNGDCFLLLMSTSKMYSQIK